MLWLKSLHIIFMVTWMGGLFYLPRLFVYHAMTQEKAGQERFKIMERKLFFGIMTPGAIFTVLFGVWILVDGFWAAYHQALWLHLKLGLVGLLLIYHGLCFRYLLDFKRDQNRHSHVFYRWFNEIPVLLLVAIVILVVVKPF